MIFEDNFEEMFLKVRAGIFAEEAEDRAFMYGVLIEKVFKTESSWRSDRLFSYLCCAFAIGAMLTGAKELSLFIYIFSFTSFLGWLMASKRRKEYFALKAAREIYEMKFMETKKFSQDMIEIFRKIDANKEVVEENGD